MEAKAKNDQLVRETFQKLAQVILQSRVVFPPTPPAQKRINKWFNLEIEELDTITSDMVTWNNLQAPLFLELYFPLDPPPHPDYSPLMERWKIVYQPSAAVGGVELPQGYKHLVLLVRSVAGLLRSLPAFHPFRNSVRARASPSSHSYSSSPYSYSSSPAYSSSPSSLSSPSHPEIRYSFHSSFPSSREFSSSRPTQEFNFDPVTLPFGTLVVSVTYRTDCSVEIGATESHIGVNAHVIKDYSPSPDSTPSSYPPRSTYTNSAPIGIPGKDAPEPIMPVVLSPPSSLTMGPGFTPPGALAPHRGSLPNPQAHLSSSPMGIPIGMGNQRFFSPPAFSSSPTGSGGGYGFGQYQTGSGMSVNTSGSSGTINSSGSANNAFNSSGGSAGSGGSAKLRPRAASYAPPPSAPISITPPFSQSAYKPPLAPKEPFGTSPSSRSPSSTPPSSLVVRPATNMYMSTLLGPSIHLTSPTSAAYLETNPFTSAFEDELAFAGEKVEDEIGEFIRMCKNAPALKRFNPEGDKRYVGSSFLFADNMTMSQVSNKLVSFSLTDPPQQ